MTMTKDDLSHHISSQFNEDLLHLHAHVLKMGRLVISQTQDALDTLRDSDVELARKVASGDLWVNAEEVSIDEECTRILVRRQPAASDLRMIFSAIKTVTDLERIGDLAERIAITVLESAPTGPDGIRLPVLNLGNLVLRQLTESIDCLAAMDAELALKIVAEDKTVDQEFQAVLRQLLTYMMEDPRTIGWAMQLSWAARAMERIGDHAKNIAEYIIYMVHGADIRHTSPSEQNRLIHQADSE